MSLNYDLRVLIVKEYANRCEQEDQGWAIAKLCHLGRPHIKRKLQLPLTLGVTNLAYACDIDFIGRYKLLLGNSRRGRSIGKPRVMVD